MTAYERWTRSGSKLSFGDWAASQPDPETKAPEVETKAPEVEGQDPHPSASDPERGEG